MKKISIILLVLPMCFLTEIFSQPCLPDGITFNTQAQIDNFQTNYPNCTEIEGDVEINGDEITNLNGLNVLTSIGGKLNIGWMGSTSLNSLNGLDNLTSIGGELIIWASDPLSNLVGLNNLILIGGDLRIGSSSNLTSLAGLENLISIGGTLFIKWNASLLSLTGLSNVTSIGGNLDIALNSALTSLSGLENINASTIDDIYIAANTSLTTCEVESICNYLASPNGTVTIEYNASGCNTSEEVEDACWTSVDELNPYTNLTVFPNPFNDQTSIEFNLMEPGFVKLSVVDYTGTEVQKIISNQTLAGVHQFEWNAEGSPAGIYFLKLEMDGKAETNKIILMR